MATINKWLEPKQTIYKQWKNRTRTSLKRETKMADKDGWLHINLTRLKETFPAQSWDWEPIWPKWIIKACTGTRVWMFDSNSVKTLSFTIFLSRARYLIVCYQIIATLCEMWHVQNKGSFLEPIFAMSDKKTKFQFF